MDIRGTFVKYHDRISVTQVEIELGGPRAHLLLKTGSLMGSELVAQGSVQLGLKTSNDGDWTLLQVSCATALLSAEGKVLGLFLFRSYIQFGSLLFLYLSFLSSPQHDVLLWRAWLYLLKLLTHRGRLLFLCPPKPLHAWAEVAPSPVRTHKVWADLLPVTLLVPGRLFFLAVLHPGWAGPGWHWSQGLLNPRCNTFHLCFLSFTRFLSPNSCSSQPCPCDCIDRSL